MALPFIAGAILGGLAVAAFGNKEKIKSALETGLDKGKEFAQNAKDYAQKKASEVKEYAEEKFAKASEEVKSEIKNRKRRTSEEVAAEKASTIKQGRKKPGPKAKKPVVIAEQEQVKPQELKPEANVTEETKAMADSIANALEANLGRNH